MDKLVVDNNGKATISNDGATIMKLLDIVHPAAKTLVDIAKSQDAEVSMIVVTHHSDSYNLKPIFYYVIFLLGWRWNHKCCAFGR